MSIRSSTGSSAATPDARASLRQATASDHERLDALFGGFRLDDEADYRVFLRAHAMALTAIEDALDAAGFEHELQDWPRRRRAAAIAADLVALGETMPPALPAPLLGTPAAQWGAAYVVEGSRLGGALLARQVPDGLPRSYLGTPQSPGAWRAFLACLDKALTGAQDIEAATIAARASFSLFETAGRHVMKSGNQ